ncbi:glycosyl hydrolase [Mucilaginibacter dorajii]|uniref:Glycosyl hydrolase n=1 Tax=Mucilaginibacter dorajii TaxID=692994 RepID=A0ABP7QXB6_9SPHI
MQTLSVQSGPKLEAESGTLSGGAVSVADTGRSGGYFVEQNAGNISYQVSIPANAYYNIYISAASPYATKTNILSIDGSDYNFTIAQNAAFAEYKIASTYFLAAGTRTIAINKSYGYLQIDYVRIEILINPSLVTPGASPEANNVYQFLRNNYGTKIISGVMTLSSFDETNWLKTNTGKEPVIMGVDFMNSNRGYTWYNNLTPTNNAKTWWDKNGIPVMNWHWRDPSRATESFNYLSTAFPNGATFDVTSILTPGSTGYNQMIADIDYVSNLLVTLQSQHVPVLWRPLHEASGGWFWWGAKGSTAYKKLWQVMYDRMVNYHGLKNLIWVWTSLPGDYSWYPGDAYVDIVGDDIYVTGDHSSRISIYNSMRATYNYQKMVTISECGSMPDPDNLVADGAKWSWFMPWYGKFTESSTYNSLALWQKTMDHAYVITLDEMPSLH